MAERRIYHYTDRLGYVGIRAALPRWRFEVHKPPIENPPGAYFTTLPPDARNLGLTLRIGRAKREYVFEFVDANDLQQLTDNRGRPKQNILYSPEHYLVDAERQRYDGETLKWQLAASPEA